MKNKLTFLSVLFLFIVPAIFSMDWPSAGAVMTSNFGWNNGGLPQLGISFEGGGEITAAEKGELLYRRREGETASKLPSPLGSWAALDHGDGIISICGRFDDENSPAIPFLPERGKVIAEAGKSGWASAKGFYFQLFDRKERRWINPAMIANPPEDTRPPAILSVRLTDSQGTVYDPSQQKNLAQGRYVVSVGAADTMLLQNEAPLAPYRIICSLNGSEVGVLNFETYSVRDGALVVHRNGLVPVRQVYASPSVFEVADVWVSRGQTTMEIIAQDIAGNVRNVVFRLMFE